jgi:hypothetical protein
MGKGVAVNASVKQVVNLVPGLSPIDLAARALPVLGWDGFSLVEARAWSTRRLIACALDPVEHRRRQAEKLLPVADPLLLRCVAAEDPEFMLAPPPVQIAGAIAVRRTWKGAIANLAGFAAFGSLAAVLPSASAERTDVATEAPVQGVGVVAAEQSGTVRLVCHASVHTMAKRTWVHRLIEEIVYDAMLNSLSRAEAAIGVKAPPSSAGSLALPTQSADQA